MKNNENHIDQVFKDGLDDFEVPFNEAHWNEMEAKIDQQGLVSDNGSWSAGKFAAAIGTVALVATAIYFITGTSQDQATPKNNSELVMPQNDIAQESENNVSANGTSKTQASQDKVVKGTEESLQTPISNNKNIQIDEEDDNLNLENEINDISAKNSQQAKMNIDAFKKEVPGEIEDEQTKNFNNINLKTEFTASKTNVCVGEKVQFSINQELDNVNYFWNFGDGITSTKTNPEIVFNKPGSYSVTLITAGGEKNSYTVKEENYITVGGHQVDFEWDDTELSVKDPYIEFTAKSETPDLSYSWEIDGVQKTGKTIPYKFDEKGEYRISVKATDANKCVAKSEKSFYLSQQVPPFIEDGFILDNDGINDEFPLKLYDQFANVNFELKILSPEGSQVFHTTDANQAWNGKFNNSGNWVKAGRYRWTLSWVDKNGVINNTQGILVVARP